MFKKAILLAIMSLAGVLVVAGCAQNNNDSTSAANQSSASGYKTERTDYTIFFTEPSPVVLGGAVTQQYIVGHPIPEAETIKYNAYFVPWRIDFSQVQRTSLEGISVGCNNLEEQVVYIDGWIDIDFSELEFGVDDLPNYGPAYPKGTIHETVTGTSGVWSCPESEIATASMNAGSAEYVQSVSGDHVANFSGASNMTSMTISGADIYLDLSYEDKIQFIWPAGTKIEYAPEGTPIPLEPLPPSSL